MRTNPLTAYFLSETGDSPAVQTPTYRLTRNGALNRIHAILQHYRFHTGDKMALYFTDPVLQYLFIMAALQANVELYLLPSANTIPETTVRLFSNEKEMENSGGTFVSREMVEELAAAVFPANEPETDFNPQQKIWFYSSGTTGEAKLVPVSYAQVLAALACIRENRLMPYTENQCVLLTPPLYHSYGFSALLEYAAGGSMIILPDSASLQAYIKVVFNKNLAAMLTAIEGVPYMHKQIGLMLSRTPLPQLVHIGFGGDAVEPGIAGTYRKHYSHLSFSVRYGLTEIPSVIALYYCAAGDGNFQPENLRVLPVFTIHIAGDNHEISVAYKKETANTFALTTATLRTGDAGEWRENKLVITGRLKNRAKVRGFAVNARTLEALAIQFPGVRNAKATFANEKIMLELEAEAGKVDEAALRMFIGQQLPEYYLPDTVQFTDHLPVTATGKIIRHEST